jgi:hypothetical protein
MNYHPNILRSSSPPKSMAFLRCRKGLTISGLKAAIERAAEKVIAYRSDAIFLFVRILSSDFFLKNRLSSILKEHPVAAYSTNSTKCLKLSRVGDQ